MRTHPFLPILYVDITPVSKVAVYTHDHQGRLNFVRAVGDAGAAPCRAVVNHAGTHLYATNTGDNSIEVYSLASPVFLQIVEMLWVPPTAEKHERKGFVKLS